MSKVSQIVMVFAYNNCWYQEWFTAVDIEQQQFILAGISVKDPQIQWLVTTKENPPVGGAIFITSSLVSGELWHVAQ